MMSRRINAIMVIGVALNFIGVLQVLLIELPLIFFLGFTCLWIISVFGLMMSLSPKSKAGPILVIIGSILFFPLGLIAVIGARNSLDILKREEFENFDNNGVQ